jgi:hypothetical protein
MEAGQPTIYKRPRGPTSGVFWGPLVMGRSSLEASAPHNMMDRPPPAAACSPHHVIELSERSRQSRLARRQTHGRTRERSQCYEAVSHKA